MMAISIVFSKGFVGDLEAFSLAAIHVAAFPTGVRRRGQIAWLTSRAMVNKGF
jgi:hypothetical protein